MSCKLRKYSLYTCSYISCFSYQEVEEKFGNRIHQQNGSPARSVITELGARGMTIEELVFVLDQLKMEKTLMYLKKYGLLCC